MISIKESIKNLNRFDKILWTSSLIAIIISFIISKGQNTVTLISSTIGITALIFMAKGDVLGQILTVVFSVFYGIVSLKMKYYGEMITYLCMTTPIALISIFTWLKNPFMKHQVKINRLGLTKSVILFVVSIIVTIIFYFILRWLGNASLIISTVSIFTSFLACALGLLRSPYYAIGYAGNDIVLIILWCIASHSNIEYLPMIICFIVFLINDIYAFISWSKMHKIQQQALKERKRTEF